MGMLMVDERGFIALVNAEVARMFGYERCELIGQPLELLVPPRLRAQYPRLRADFFAKPRARAMASGDELYGLRKDGSEVPIEIGLNPLRTPEGSFVLSAIVENTEGKRIEERLAAVRQEKAVLLSEIQHRVKNNLQVLSSLLNLQANHGSDEAIRAALEVSLARVQAIALAHEQLSQSPDLSRIDFCGYARALSEQLIRARQDGRPNITCSVRACDRRLPLDVCIMCGLVVNELVTNALKHAFQGRARGEISISLIRHHDLLELRVSDDGVGLPEHVELGKAKSFGLDLVALLAKRLQSTVVVTRQSGTTLTLQFKET